MSWQNPDELKEAARLEWERLEGLAQPLKPRDRMALPAQEMPTQEPLARARNMREVATGYFADQARVEAQRCLQCKNAPCVNGCPVSIRIPDFIAELVKGDPAAAIRIIKQTSLLPAVCGRVCPQETQCQQPCTLGKALKSVEKAVAIGRLERYAADWEREHNAMQSPVVAPATGRKVAVVGSGPAGITVAADVRRAGHEVVLFEAFHKAGGVLVYGIPEFRLPKAIVQTELDALKQMGVEIRTNFVVGRTRKLADLLEKDGFDAVFVGTGAGLPKFMNIEGENLVGVYSANEYLTRSNLMKAYNSDKAFTPIHSPERVAVLGGGNVAMDAARTALRLGAKNVHLIYRRTEVEMPARVEEVRHAKEEGVQFHLLQNARRILGEKGRVTAVECLRYELGEPDASGRRRPVEVAGSEFQIPIDAVIIAIGNESNPLIKQTTPGLETDKWGHILTDENGRTSLPKVFAGGDIVLGAATVILAMGEGRKAAAAINALLSQP
ncbi:MAG: NADPH-dependent glutamate synthase [Verrucomicrobiota bacterium]|jgi:glutamate synthase (NADPH/NADH) small chain|nr:NADPH-dependent glutamate synthase [Verrucomicrobiota bacterium]